MHEQFIVSIRDLQLLEIHCRHCNTRVTLDLETEFGPPRAPFYVPRECPRCASQFDSAVAPAVENMQRVWKALAGLGDTVTFVAKPAPAAPAKP